MIRMMEGYTGTDTIRVVKKYCSPIKVKGCILYDNTLDYVHHITTVLGASPRWRERVVVVYQIWAL